MKKKLCKLTLLFLAALPFGVASVPANAQSSGDWYRRQQQQQQMRQQQQEQQRRQQQLEQQRQQQRQQMREQMQQQQRQQMREQMQQQQRQQMQQQQRQQQMQQRRQLPQASTGGGVQRRAGRADGYASIVNRRNDRIVYSNGVVKLARPLTAVEMRRGFTGKVTQDGRALVKFNGRVFAVPAARAGIRPNRSRNAGAPLATRWSESKRAAVSAEVRKVAATSLRNRGRAGGGRRPPGGGGGDDGSGGKVLWTSWAQYPKVRVRGESYAKIGPRLYTKHAIERMQPSGLGYPAGASAKSLGKDGIEGKGRSVSPTYVEEVIRTGKRTTQITPEGVRRTLYSAGTTTIVTEENGKIVVSVLTR